MISTAAFFVMGRYRIPWVPGLLLLGAAGMVDLEQQFQIATVAGHCMASRPVDGTSRGDGLAADLRPGSGAMGSYADRHGIADALAGRLEPAIDALDNARAFGTGPAERVEQLLTAGPLHDALGALIALRPKVDRQAGLGPDSDVRLARWMRQFPSGRGESRRLLDQRSNRPRQSQHNRERGAW